MIQKEPIALLISGRGSNMAAIMAACTAPDFPAYVSVVLSNTAGAKGLAIAAKAHIPTVVVSHKNFPTRAQFETALLEALRPYPITLVCLAGFMRVLGPTFIHAWPQGRILNIHPSLLPLYKGLNTHARVLEARDRQTGCTVHVVTEDLDSGPIILQYRVEVLTDDTPQTLADRVLAQEHKAYPAAIRKVLENL